MDTVAGCTLVDTLDWNTAINRNIYKTPKETSTWKKGLKKALCFLNNNTINKIWNHFILSEDFLKRWVYERDTKKRNTPIPQLSNSDWHTYSFKNFFFVVVVDRLTSDSYNFGKHIIKVINCKQVTMCSYFFFICK